MRTNVNDRFSIVLIKHNLQSLFSLLSFDLPVISFDKVTLNLPKLLISVPAGIRNRRERHVGKRNYGISLSCEGGYYFWGSWSIFPEFDILLRDFCTEVKRV